MNNPVPSPKRTILVAEDEELIRSLISEYLDEVGFSVLEACNAVDALALIGHTDVDLVLTDINMPGSMDGHDLADWLETHRPTLPVILTSGLVAMASGKSASLRRFIAKPYQLADLERHIRDLLH